MPQVDNPSYSRVAFERFPQINRGNGREESEWGNIAVWVAFIPVVGSQTPRAD
jgi:hypothetical protein